MPGDYQFRDDDRPLVPGAPYTPPISARLKRAYIANAIVLVLLATFGQGLYATNIAAVAGGYGLTGAEATWLGAVYAGFAAANSLFLIKGRQQFGVMPVARALLWLALAVSALVLVAPGFATALVGRAVNGLVTATMTAVAVYYLMAALPRDKRPAALPIVLGCLQLGTPLARMVPVDVVTAHGNLGLHLLNLAAPLTQLLFIALHPLPPTPTARVFEWRDAWTIGLLFPAILLLCAVLALGRTFWWSDAPWIGWLAALAVPLFAAGLLLEYGRARPMLSIGWMTQRDILLFALVMVIERIAIAEQSVGASGLFSAAGLNNDQLRGLFAVVMLAELVGVLAVVLTMSERSLPWQALAALLMIATGAWIDSGANGLTRPADMVLSQVLVGAGTTIFIGPSLAWIALRMLKTGAQYLVTMIMVFSFTQNVGSLVGSALLSSYQYAQAQAHGEAIADRVTADDPQVAERIRREAAAAVPASPGSAGALALGAANLGRSAGQQAVILGLLDAFRLIAGIALAGALALAAAILGRAWLSRREEGRT